MQIELVDVDVPLLISRRSLASMGNKIDCSTNVLEIKGGRNSPLRLSSGGNLLLEIRPPEHPMIQPSAFSPAYVQDSIAIDCNGEDEENDLPSAKNRKKELAVDDIRKVHKQLGHASHSSLSHLLRQAGRSSADQFILDALNKRNCHRADSKA